ncbi:MAG: hypothetical protein AB1757_04435 [Acidobacteriota bacterium]
MTTSFETDVGESLAARGKRFHDEHLKSQLEPEHHGRFVAIEPDSGRYFPGDTLPEAVHAGRAAMPGKQFYLNRIGFRAVYNLGGYGFRK